MIEKAVDPTVSKDEYREYLKDFAWTDDEKNAVDELKQCFLHITSVGCDGKFRLSVPIDTFNLTLNMIHCYPIPCFF